MRTATFLATLKQLPIEKARRIRKIRNKQSQMQSVAGLKLLTEGFNILGLRRFHLKKLTFGCDKPELHNGCFFSISHSQECICCALSNNTAIGIDVEKTRPLTASIISKYQLKHNDILPITAWTQKEAVLKVFPGNKLSELKDIDLSGNTAFFKNRLYHLKSFDIAKKFTLSIARTQANTNIKIKRVYF